MLNKILLFFAFIFLLGPLRAQTMEQFQVLIFTEPDRWHNKTNPNAMIEFRKMADRHTFGLTWTQLARNFNDEYLEQFDVIVFFHARGGALNEEQMDSFKKFVRSGKGFVAIHGSSANRQEDWFKKLIGRNFMGHPEEQAAVLNIVDKTFPATMHLNDKWIWTDEWYKFGEPLTENIKDIITIDENTFETDRTWGDDRDFAMGEYHPIAWYQEYDGGRSFYTTLGHLPMAYEDPWFMAHLFGGIYWAATGLGDID